MAFPVEEHTALLDEAVGYFKEAGGNGGEGGTVVYVQNLNTSGAGSLKDEMESAGAKIILFENGLSGIINTPSRIEPASDKTVWGRHRDGTAADITVKAGQASAIWRIQSGSRNIIIANLKTDGTGFTNDNAPDVVSVFDDGAIVWVHHVTTIGDGTNKLDGFVDVTTDATDVTVSFCRAIDWDNVHLLRTTAANGTKIPRVTMHHNLYRNCTSRMSKTDGGTSTLAVLAHFYNNWIDTWTATTASDNINGGSERAENNIYDAGITKEALRSPWGGQGVNGGNLFTNGATHSAPETVFTPPYSYVLETANQALRDKLEADAGWQSSFAPLIAVPLELQDRHSLPERSPGPKRGSHVWLESRQTDLFLPVPAAPPIGPPVGRAVAGLS